MSPVEGIDISHHQAATPPLDAVGFVFVRATYGLTPDDGYAQHAANVHAAGKVLGAYHFGREVQDPVAQARAFLNVIGPGVQLVALDVERDDHPVPIPDDPPMTSAQAARFIQTVQATGRKVGLYHSESGYPHVGQDFNWIAKWGTTPPAGSWAFWQYADKPGTDHDRFSGTPAQLEALAGHPLSWIAIIPKGTPLRYFTVENGVITGVRTSVTKWDIRRPCSHPHKLPWPGHLPKLVVKLDQDGAWIPAKYAHEVNA